MPIFITFCTHKKYVTNLIVIKSQLKSSVHFLYLFHGRVLKTKSCASEKHSHVIITSTMALKHLL
jgi:hypothetical protein